MDTGTFYATTSAVSFTLLGFWWVVVQFRHDEMTGDLHDGFVLLLDSTYCWSPVISSWRNWTTTHQNPSSVNDTADVVA